MNIKVQRMRVLESCKFNKVFKSGLSKFFKGYLLQNLLSPFLNSLSQMIKHSEKKRNHYLADTDSGCNLKKVQIGSCFLMGPNKRI